MNVNNLPHSLESEKRVLGAMMRFRDSRLAVMRILEPGAFYQPGHQVIFSSIVTGENLYGAGLDLLLLSEILEQSGELEHVGGCLAIMELVNNSAESVSAVHHAKIIQEKFRQREIIKFSEQIIQDAPRKPSDESLAFAYQQIINLGLSNRSNGPQHVRDCLDGCIDRVQEKMQRKRTGRPFRDILTGLHDLDSLTGGMGNGELWTLGARPGEGKSLIAVQVAMSAAQNKPVIYFSLEMSAQELLQRPLISCHGQTDKELASSVLKKAGQLSKLSLHIDDSAGLDIEQIACRCEWLKADKGELGLIVLDYLGLIRPSADYRRSNPVQVITHITNSAKLLARKCNCPLLLLSQLNRSCENEGRAPRLSDLRDSGSIEQDSDLIGFLFRPQGVERGASGVRELAIQKNRSGPTGEIKLIFDAENLTFNGMSSRVIPDEAVNW